MARRYGPASVLAPLLLFLRRVSPLVVVAPGGCGPWKELARSLAGPERRPRIGLASRWWPGPWALGLPKSKGPEKHGAARRELPAPGAFCIR